MTATPPPLPRRHRLALRLATAIGGPTLRAQLAALSAPIDDRPGWVDLTNRTYDRPNYDREKILDDALTAVRKNPLAKAIIETTTDFVIGDGITITSPDPDLATWLPNFTNHPENRLALRLPDLCSDLARDGELFIALHRNPVDGMSYIRAIPARSIAAIETAENDWEHELTYTDTDTDKAWVSQRHPRALTARAVVCHYAVNRPARALRGDSDLATLIPWLLRYSRMLEDRVRLHWALRVYLWFVKVPDSKVAAKHAQYAAPPEPGSVIVHTPDEEWSMQTPNLHGDDAGADMKALRHLIYAGARQPGHWHGEQGSNRAEALMMQQPAERHLRQRQEFLTYALTDLLATAYRRYCYTRHLQPPANLEALIQITRTDISRTDNLDLATAGRAIALALKVLQGSLPGYSQTLATRMITLFHRFTGADITAEELSSIIEESWLPENAINKTRP